MIEKKHAMCNIRTVSPSIYFSSKLEKYTPPAVSKVYLVTV
jgi:hypothetical protein